MKGHQFSISLLVDTGASTVVISQRLVQQLNLPLLQGPPYTVTFGDGSTTTRNSYVKTSFDIAGHTVMGEFRTTELAPSIDAILGCDAIRQLHMVVDLDNERVTFSDGTSAPFITQGAVPSSLVEVSMTAIHKDVKHAYSSGAEDSVYVVFLQSDSEPDLRSSSSLPMPSSEANTSSNFRKAILSEYSDVFPDQLPTTLPPVTRAGIRMEHTIELTPGAQPVRQRAYKRGMEEQAIIKQHIDQMLADGLIEPSQSPWASPVLLVKKSDGSWRFCCDLRRVNKVIKRSAYPLPDALQVFDRLRGARYFTSLDLRSGYHQIRMDPESVPITAFTTQFGSYQWRVLPFGIATAPSAFQSIMNQLLHGFIGNFVCCYLDDVLIYSKTLEQHEQHVRQVLDKFREAQLYCKLKKCDFCRTQIDFLGHVVSYNTVAMQPAKLQAIRNWQPPTSVTQLQRFLGFVNYYRRFIPRHSHITAYLSRLASNKFKGRKFVWDLEAQRAFDATKAALLEGSSLAIPDVTGQLPFTLQTDACDDCIAGVLTQDGRIVDCFSRKLQGAELRYPIREKELLAIVSALRRYAHYIGQSLITVYTDHRSLIHLDTMNLHSPIPQQRRIARWWMDTLCYFNLRLVYLPGNLNIPADALSRRHLDGDDVVELTAIERADEHAADTSLYDGGDNIVKLNVILADPSMDTSSRTYQLVSNAARQDDLFVATTSVSVTLSDELTKRIIAGYDSDPAWSDVYKAHAGLTNDPDSGKQRVRFSRTKLDDDSKLLYYYRNDLPDHIPRLVIPSGSVRDTLLAEHHESSYAAHMGAKRMLSEMARRYWWPGIHRDVKSYCRSCDSCQRAKATTLTTRAPLEPLPVPDRPFSPRSNQAKAGTVS